jgi:hypothetical protein
MNAFLTGSRAYGVPHADSDTDIVIYVDQTTMAALTEIADDETPKQLGPEYSMSHSKSLRFGKLNIIATTDEAEFRAWDEGTNCLISQQPVCRSHAVDLFKRLLFDVHNQEGYQP